MQVEVPARDMMSEPHPAGAADGDARYRCGSCQSGTSASFHARRSP